MAAERIIVSGDLDIATIDAFADQIARTTATLVELDASALGFVDSTGLRALLVAKSNLVREGRRLVVIEPSHSLRMLLEIAGVTDLLD
jgi:anti-anti-sigma factor